jgi:hypothetical protein
MRIGFSQALDHQLRQPRQLVAQNPDREHQADRLRGQPAGNEPNDLGRSLIQPLRVVDQAD